MLKQPKLSSSSLFLFFFFFLLALAACGDSPTTNPLPRNPTVAPTITTSGPVATSTIVRPAGSPTIAPPPVPNTPGALQPGPGLTPGVIPDEIKAVYAAAAADLTDRYKFAPDSVRLAGYNAEDFNDASLGCPARGGMYTQVITPGYRVSLEVAGNYYDYRVPRSATRVVLCGPNNQPIPRNSP